LPANGRAGIVDEDVQAAKPINDRIHGLTT
jgi:hypothetical protein